jgi:two-component system chemotaxis response regulator CheY
LVVDDNANMATIVRTILHSFGIRKVHEAHDVGDAFAKVRDHAVDIVILDYNLGFMDGIDFAKMMRTASDSPNHYLPIIMLTAYTEHYRVETARDAGVNEFCAKPVTATQIYRRICEIIERPRPYVRTASYFGPDRRRHDMDERYRGPERRVAQVAEAS